MRPASDGGQVLLVHRPKYDDWGLPKGKLDPGESTPLAAVREVWEETGVKIRLGRPLNPQNYPVSKGDKVVDYWVGKVRDREQAEAAVSGYVANAEIDRVEWVDVDKAIRQLTYSRDRVTVAEAVGLSRATRAAVLVDPADVRRAKPLITAYDAELLSELDSPADGGLDVIQGAATVVHMRRGVLIAVEIHPL